MYVSKCFIHLQELKHRHLLFGDKQTVIKCRESFIWTKWTKLVQILQIVSNK